jgi:hypothetical protein
MKHQAHIISANASVIIDTLKYKWKVFKKNHPSPYDPATGNIIRSTVTFFINEAQAATVLPELSQRLSLAPVGIETDNLIAIHCSLTPGYEFDVFNTDAKPNTNLNIIGLPNG